MASRRPFRRAETSLRSDGPHDEHVVTAPLRLAAHLGRRVRRSLRRDSGLAGIVLRESATSHAHIVLPPRTRGQTSLSDEGPIVGPFLGLVLLSLPLLGFARSLLGNEPLPSFTPVLASLLQSGALLGLHR